MSWTAAKSVTDSLGQNQWKTLLNTQTIKTSTEPEHYKPYQIQRRRFTGRFRWFFKHTHTHTHTISMSSELSRAEPGHSSGHLTGEIKESHLLSFCNFSTERKSPILTYVYSRVSEEINISPKSSIEKKNHTGDLNEASDVSPRQQWDWMESKWSCLLHRSQLSPPEFQKRS